MLRTKNFGRKSLNEIKEILSNLGLGFGMKFDAQGRLVPAPGGSSVPHYGPEIDDEEPEQDEVTE
jgi:DNA-directed RNA polymerase subunit alpha